MQATRRSPSQTSHRGVRVAATGIASILATAVLFHGTSEPELPVHDFEGVHRLAWEMSIAALRGGAGSGSACKRDDKCDRLTGCIAPQTPPGPILEVLPAGPDYERYVRGLRVFQACRELVLEARKSSPSNVQAVRLAPSELETKAFADAVMRWNGDIFWEPASQSSNVVTRSGDEARSVFGPIPDGDCGGPAARIIPREVDGNIVDLRPNPAKPGHPLEFEHRDQNGDVVKWTDTLAKCDKPSLAASGTFCALNSRMTRAVRGNVEWLFFCRKSHHDQEVSTDPYWLRSDPRFRLFGTIGFNQQSGEIVFFDGRKDRTFDWSQPFVPPGGRSYSDSAGRAKAAAIYDPTFQIPCHACHDNKSPYVIDPHAAQGRVGYVFAEKDPRAIAFSLRDYLPERPRLPDSPFRVVGSAYTSTYSVDLGRAKTIQDPTGNCTGCHTLTTQVTGQRLAPDAVAREPWITLPTWGQLVQLRYEKIRYAAAAAHRTDWALRGGGGGIHPWMVPGRGNELSLNSPGLSAQDWQRLSDCLWDAGGAECGYRPLYTPCPAPESEGEGSSLTDAAVQVLPPPAGKAATTRVLRVSWKYLNSYGGVPERDDVRVNVAIKTTAIPADRTAPESSAYPNVDDAKGIDFEAGDDAIGAVGSSLLIQNVSYAGHRRWTDPTPFAAPRNFQLDLPGKCNQRYLVRLLPKRFCFDQSKAAFSPLDHLIYADVDCD